MADDIETVCKRMVADANAQFTKYEQEKKKKGIKSTYTMSVFLSGNEASKGRTPEEQAAEVLAGRSWTCNGSHITDSARHVAPKLNGKYDDDALTKLKKVSKDDYDKFIDVYSSAMKKQGLRNFKTGADFLPNSEDPWHMELKDSRMSDSDPRVQKCLLTYAKATREGGQKKNPSFESGNPAAKKFLEDYDKKFQKTAGPADAGAAPAAP
ncbi:MAG TPA: hypothetical protein VFE51_16990 [Verrucomicrobiae bacterium]|nr:hypothetical protein [Verrucomicrobiae bacterium]